MHVSWRLALANLAVLCYPAYAGYEACLKHKTLITREANLRFGAQAPIPAINGMFFQESQCNPLALNKSDGGAGIGQLTGAANIKWISEQSGIKPLNVWDITDNVRASLWLLKFNYDRIPGTLPCEKIGAALSAYNGGLGFVLASYSVSNSSHWFYVTEYLKGGGRQSAENFAYARSYPRKVLFKHQPKYASLGTTLCTEYREYGN